MVYVSPQGLRRIPLLDATTFLDLKQSAFKHHESVKQVEDRVVVYKLKLEDDGSLGHDKQYIRLPPPEKPYILRLNLKSGSSVSHNTTFYTNYPIDGSQYEGKKFHSIKSLTDFTRTVNFDIAIKQSGSFEFYLEYTLPAQKTGEKSQNTRKSPHGYFSVDPILHVMSRPRILSPDKTSDGPTVSLPIDGIVIQTVLPKLFGPISRWEPLIKSISDLGYNMVHFVPMQVRGKSDSPFSIYNQLEFSNDLFDEQDQHKSVEEKNEIVSNILKKMENEYGVLSLTDVVWNHTAHNCQWLKEHPEAAYNVHNSPHLSAAYELDTALLHYSENLKSYNLPTRINSEKDIDAIINGIKTHVLPKLRLWEFYTIDVKASIEELRKALENDEETDDTLFKEFDVACLNLGDQVRLMSKALEPKSFGPRHYRKIRKPAALAFVKKWRDTKVKAAMLEAIAKAKGEAEERLKAAVLARTTAEIKSPKNGVSDVTENKTITAEKEAGARAEVENYTKAKDYVEARFKALATANENNERLNQKDVMEKGNKSAEDIKSTTVGRAMSRSTSFTIDNDSEDNEQIRNLPIPAVDTIEPCIDDIFRHYETILNEINLPFYKTYDKDVGVILNNLRNRLKYLRLDAHGPKLGEITKKSPFIETYFTRLRAEDVGSDHPAEELAVANNGWIWNANPLVDFASADSNAYLRREVIVWGDCVKLRYGKSRDDNPWLWDHMTKYTTNLAKMFHGFRIDNCHSTPIHVAKHLLDAARRVRPNLYVVAELFTGSGDLDIRFVRELGINSLIRESLKAWDSPEMARLIHEYGGKYIGSMSKKCISEESVCTSPDGQQNASCIIVPIVGSKPHALLMDCTHDNETPHQIRTAEDTLPNSALTTMASCAVGSVRGYDEINPYLINLATEKRLYKIYENPVEVGIGKVKRILQHLHTEMAIDGFSETYLHQEKDYIIIHRVHPRSYYGYLLVARSAFSGNANPKSDLSPFKLRGASAELEQLFSAQLEINSRTALTENGLLNGLPATIKKLHSPIVRKLSDIHGPYVEFILPAVFPPGSVILLRTAMDDKLESLEDFIRSGADEACQHLDLVDLNIALYRCSGEEGDVTPGHGSYTVPGHGELPYCGIAGFMSVTEPILKYNNLGHPFCNNLREGHWALNYVVARLDRHLSLAPNLKPLREWFDERFAAIKSVPNFLVPKYFAIVIKTAYDAARKRAIEQFSPFVQEGGLFIQSLALTSVQMYGVVHSTALHPVEGGPSMAAGLPHFTFRHMRVWGRDVFISLRGLFLTTGNYEAAKRHIIAFGGVVKNGLVPNLLDAGRFPRYNCRDAAWWYLQAIQDYCTFSPDNIGFLKERVQRRFPEDVDFVVHDHPSAYSYSSTIADIIQEILESHAKGIHFREWNAGPDLDTFMKDEGFQIDIDVDWDTGFIYGGNKWNCGTWMDKMGESANAGNLGIPSTPRDGAAIEIIGLLKSALRWVSQLYDKGLYPYEGVNVDVKGEKKFIKFKEWGDLIQKSFEKYFYIPKDSAFDSQHVINSKLVNRRGIYKDTYRSSKEYADYQLRPNFPVAMVTAPELFDEQHAMEALRIAKEVLAGPLGMRTLDPTDWAYRGVYDNSNDGTDKSIAKGWNYHQGPEWLWCTGVFLRAYLYFDTRAGAGKDNIHETIYTIVHHLLPHRKTIETNPWGGLPELTNKDGAACHHACPTQAWSSAAILDLLYDIRKSGTPITIE